MKVKSLLELPWILPVALGPYASNISLNFTSYYRILGFNLFNIEELLWLKPQSFDGQCHHGKTMDIFGSITHWFNGVNLVPSVCQALSHVFMIQRENQTEQSITFTELMFLEFLHNSSFLDILSRWLHKSLILVSMVFMPKYQQFKDDRISLSRCVCLP